MDMTSDPSGPIGISIYGRRVRGKYGAVCEDGLGYSSPCVPTMCGLDLVGLMDGFQRELLHRSQCEFIRLCFALFIRH